MHPSAPASSVVFDNAFVPNPACCPSRTTILTGDYSHTTGVYGNFGPYGGFGAFDDRHTIATDLRRAGYRTGLVGKYLNGYGRDDFDYIPPGWSRWFEVKTGAYYDYYADRQGRSIHYGTEPRDYSTRVLVDRAVRFVQNASKPFFLYFTPTAPHGPAIADPRDVGRFTLQGFLHPDTFGRVQDGAPAYIRSRHWSEQRARAVDAFHRRQLDSAFGVDRAVGQLLNVLPSNTIVLYLSDNGILWGEHRWADKRVPYNESIRIPVILTSLDGAIPVSSIDPDRIALNLDIRATLEGLARLHPQTDGFDLFDASWTRNAFVLEHAQPSDKVPTYCGVRTLDLMYTRYVDGEEELYDERNDPLESINVAATEPAKLQKMKDLARQLCSPVPPGYSW
jgi:arylsulfatase A-like enzyme